MSWVVYLRHGSTHLTGVKEHPARVRSVSVRRKKLVVDSLDGLFVTVESFDRFAVRDGKVLDLQAKPPRQVGTMDSRGVVIAGRRFTFRRLDTRMGETNGGYNFAVARQDRIVLRVLPREGASQGCIDLRSRAAAYLAWRVLLQKQQVVVRPGARRRRAPRVPSKKGRGGAQRDGTR